jgi:hypothetical protein
LDGAAQVAGVLLAEAGAAVAADVVVGPVGTVALLEDDDALLADLLDEVVARGRQPILPPHAEPAPQENVF